MSKKYFLAVAIAAAFLGMSTSTAWATLSAPANFGTQVWPSSVDLGDLDGDGYNDIVAANQSTSSVSVLMNNRNRTFATAVNYAAPGAYVAKLGRFDGDAHLDMATTLGGSSVQIRLGNGDGTFGTPTTISAGISTTIGLSVGDFNEDAKADLAVTAYQGNSANTVRIMLGNGDGTFATAVGYPTGAGSRSVAIGDLNSDAHQDLVVSNSGTDNLSVLLGTGTGTFTGGTTVSGGITPYFATLADLNGDAKLDLAQTNYGQGVLTVRFGNGDGTFQTNTNYTVGSLPAGVAHGDIDGDGDIDLATANSHPTTGNVSLLLNNGDGTFAAAIPYTAGTAPFALAIGDLDVVPGPDLAVANQQSMNVSALFNQIAYAQAAPYSPEFGDVVRDRGSAPLTVTLTNAYGGDPMTVSSLGFSGTDAGDFSIAEETCTTAPVVFSGTCTIDVVFEPSALGTRTADLDVEYGGFEGPLAVSLEGVGIEPTPPDTVINSGPDGNIEVDTATFAFHGTPEAEIAKIQCRRDQGDWFDCSSPHTFDGLSNGGHSVSFRAVDIFGLTDPTPASRLFTVSVSPPPPVKATIGKVVVKGPAKAKRGKKATYRVQITNTGTSTATGVTIKVRGKGIKVNREVGSIPAGKTRVVKVKIKPKKTGRIKATFRVTSKNAGSKTARKAIRVRG